MPPDTAVSLSLVPNVYTSSISLTIATNNDTVVKGVVLHNDGLFRAQCIRRDLGQRGP